MYHSKLRSQQKCTDGDLCAAVVRQVCSLLYISPERCQACCVGPLAQQLELSVQSMQILSKLLLQPYLQPAVLASA